MPETTSGIFYRIDDLVPPWKTRAPPVLLHHGIGTDMGIWSEWVPILSVDRPVIRLDMRGWGKSKSAWNNECTLSDLVADLWEVVGAIGVDRLHLFGESLGGTIVLAAASENSERTVSVNMSNATFRGKGLGEVGGWETQLANGVESWSDRMMENRFDDTVERDAKLTWFELTQRRTDPEIAIAQGRMLGQIDLSEDLANLDLPISLTLPDGSPFVPLDHGVEGRRLKPDLDLRVVSGVRHGLVFSHSESEAGILRRYLAQVDSRVRSSSATDFHPGATRCRYSPSD